MNGGPHLRMSLQGIDRIVADMLAKNGLPAAANSDNLRDAGLSSMDMVNLMLTIEDMFDITLPQAKMTPENFRSIDAINALIASLG